MALIENDIEKYFVKQVKNLGALCFKFVSPGTRGVPDRLVIYKKLVAFVELKAPHKKPRPNQIAMFKKFEEQGLKVAVLSSKKQVDEYVNFLCKQN